jgi:Recombinase
MYTQQGLSINAIARLLNEEQIPTRTRTTRWERSTIWGMLRNPVVVMPSIAPPRAPRRASFITTGAWVRMPIAIFGAVCDNPPVRQDHLDAVVWTELVRMLEDPSVIQEELNRRVAALPSPRFPRGSPVIWPPPTPCSASFLRFRGSPSLRRLVSNKYDTALLTSY